MGYYTKFDLRMEGKSAQEFFELNRDVIDAAVKSSRDGYYSYDFDYVYHACFGDQEMKWYDYSKCLKAISAAYPDEVFILHGIGEGEGDSPDEWTATAKGGIVETVRPCEVHDENWWLAR